jgi:hypothetical protein
MRLQVIRRSTDWAGDLALAAIELLHVIRHIPCYG